MLSRRVLAILAIWTAVGASGFLILEALAMALYPGGTWFDRASKGYSFAHNFLCDLNSATALDGAVNPAAPFARIAMLLLAMTMIPFWWSLSEIAAARSDQSSRSPWAVRIFGTSSALVSMAIPFASTVDVGALHGVITLTSGLFGLLAAALGVHRAFRNEVRKVAWLGFIALVTGSLVMAVYLPALVAHRDAPSLPLLQKVAALVGLSWMLTTVVEAWRRAR